MIKYRQGDKVVIAKKWKKHHNNISGNVFTVKENRGYNQSDDCDMIYCYEFDGWIESTHLVSHITTRPILEILNAQL
jgi:hypothetical protein